MQQRNDIVVYVSPVGDDAWSGMLAEPNEQRSDGPFLTIKRAQLAVREIKRKAGRLPSPVTVMIREGVYGLSEPLVFEPKDSGTAECPVTYAAFEGEKPVVSGGRSITGWKERADGLWSVEIPEVRSGDWYFHQLFVGGQRRQRARLPKRGYLRATQTLYDGFHFRDGDIVEFHNMNDVAVVFVHLWESSIHYIEQVDWNSNYVQLDSQIPWGPAGPPWEKERRYYLDNVFEGLDEPGSWYLDRKTGVLYYHPLVGESPDLCDIVAPVLESTLIYFNGVPEEGRFVEHINLSGLSFQHTDARAGKGDVVNSSQAAFHQSAAIVGIGLRSCRIERCEISHVGEHGLWLRSGSQDNVVRQVQVYDLGAGGVRIGEGTTCQSEADEVARNTVDNCLIHDGNHLFYGGAGIWIGRSSYNTVTHNDVFDFYHTGISVGWQWGYQPTTAHHNTIAFNHVHHIGRGVLSDMGAIYLLGVSPGTVVRNNHIHDVLAYPKYYNKNLAAGEGSAPIEGAGIYPDEGCSGVVFENNIIHDISAICFGVNYCRDNVVRNNIFALSEHALGFNHGDRKHVSLDINTNIIVTTGPKPLFGDWRGRFRIQNNLYWNTTGARLELDGKGFDAWRSAGNDTDSIMEDPGFESLENRDFGLAPGGAWEKIGFVPIDMGRIGLYGDVEWTSKPATVSMKRDDPPAPPRKPEEIDDGFERSPSGSEPLRGFVIGRSVSVSEEAAATGNKSLKLTSETGEPWRPYVYYEPNFYDGVIKFSVDIMRLEGAGLAIEMRDWHNNPTFYQEESHPGSGVSIRVSTDGRLTASGQHLVTVSAGEWIHIDVGFSLGNQDRGVYTVAIAEPNGNTSVFDRIPYMTDGFQALNWLGFASWGLKGSSSYIDNIKLSRSSGSV
jgi:parallel beta-helix repeat protein